MDYLLDTNAISDLMWEHPKVAARASSISLDDCLVLCPVTRGEVLYGIRRLPNGKKRESLEARAAKAFAMMALEAVPPRAADQYACIKIAQEKNWTGPRRKRPVDCRDCDRAARNARFA